MMVPGAGMPFTGMAGGVPQMQGMMAGGVPQMQGMGAGMLPMQASASGVVHDTMQATASGVVAPSAANISNRRNTS